MKTQGNSTPINQTTAAGARLTSGLRVQTGLQAGAWNCRDCEGKVMGTQLFQPNCDYCQQA